MKNFLAYKGKCFDIEWYFDENGKSQGLEFYLDQPVEEKRKILNLFRLIGDMGKILDIQKFRSEEDKIYAFKPKPDRYLCFFSENKKIIVTNAFVKKSQKLPKKEKDKALKNRESYFQRIQKGDYYEEK